MRRAKYVDYPIDSVCIAILVSLQSELRRFLLLLCLFDKCPTNTEREHIMYARTRTIHQRLEIRIIHAKSVLVQKHFIPIHVNPG